MTNKLKVFAMLLCVAMFGTLISCTDDNGGYSVPSNDNEIYSLLIGKWQIRVVSGESVLYTGYMELKESGELQMSLTSYSGYSSSGTGSYALYKRHLDLSIYSLQDRYDCFDFSGTIYSITEDKMVLVGWHDVASSSGETPVEIQCIKVQ